MTVTRPPPKILFVHDGVPPDRHVKHLTDAGLVVRAVEADVAVATAVEWQPDIIVLDYSADGEVTARLKNHDATKHVPIVALAGLSDER